MRFRGIHPADVGCENIRTITSDTVTTGVGRVSESLMYSPAWDRMCILAPYIGDCRIHVELVNVIWRAEDKKCVGCAKARTRCV